MEKIQRQLILTPNATQKPMTEVTTIDRLVELQCEFSDVRKEMAKAADSFVQLQDPAGYEAFCKDKFYPLMDAIYDQILKLDVNDPIVQNKKYHREKRRKGGDSDGGRAFLIGWPHADSAFYEQLNELIRKETDS